MNAKQFYQLYNNVRTSLFWGGNKNLDTALIKHIERKEKIIFLQGEALQQGINDLISFDANLLWDKKFWGIKSQDSICAIATEPYTFIKSLKNKTHLSLI